ncbi:MAG: OB-fold putative lipoprotein [Burkholderiales bacterium]|nr:OB-fold putative lipoprotein [Burkholderiales bacterium]
MKFTSMLKAKKLPSVIFSALLLAGITTPVQADVTPYQKEIVQALIQMSIDDFVDDEVLEDQQEVLEDLKSRGLLQQYPDIFSVTAPSISNEYEKNEVKGDLMFQNKWLLVSGTVDAIKTKNGEPFVQFRRASTSELPVVAYFKNSTAEIPALADLHKNDFIKLICTGNSKLVEGNKDKALRVQNCEFLTAIVPGIQEKLEKQLYDALEGQGDKAINAPAVLTVLKVQQILGPEGEKECEKGMEKCIEMVTNAMDQEDEIATPKEYYDLGYTDQMLKEEPDNKL